MQANVEFKTSEPSNKDLVRVLCEMRTGQVVSEWFLKGTFTKEQAAAKIIKLKGKSK